MLDRLKTLYQLQLIDDQLDVMEELRGDLPLAVNKLNAKILSIKEQIDAKEEEKKNSLDKRISNEAEVERLKASLKKFKAQLYQVRNNKEYDALTKEIDHSEESINNLEEENITLEDGSETLKLEVEELNPQKEELASELKLKEADLKKIIKANEAEEAKLKEQREKIASDIRKSDLKVYKRIRKALNGKAVVTINRGACSGCHNIVPPQRQIEIRQSRRLFTCESCGRLLVSGDVKQEAKDNL